MPRCSNKSLAQTHPNEPLKRTHSTQDDWSRLSQTCGGACSMYFEQPLRAYCTANCTVFVLPVCLFTTVRLLQPIIMGPEKGSSNSTGK